MKTLFLVAALALAASDPLPGLYPAAPELTSEAILARVFEAAGGETWRRPESLVLKGRAVMYRGGAAVDYERYEMLRIYDWEKRDAHAADGKVRIEYWKDGKSAFVLSFDGERTYDANGPVADQSANAQWASNFGFGAIRHALDEGWTSVRLPDDMMEGRAVHMIELKDPSGGVTRFGVDAATYDVVYAGFDTPRGWHERRYSNFFRKPGLSWSQPARVRLYYDGVKQNEVIWTDFDVNVEIDKARFVVE